jgi:hypothetical protein
MNGAEGRALAGLLPKLRTRGRGFKSWLRLGNATESSGCESRSGNR